MLLTSLAFTVISANCLISGGFSGPTSHAVGARTCEWGEPIAWALSLLTNFTSTSLIVVVAWRHRQFLRDGNLSGGKSSTQQILITLVESGFVYCLVWLTQLDLFIQADYAYTFKFFVQGFIGPFGDQISAIYVMSIIVLVKKKRSISDLTQVLSMSEPSNPMVFASQGQQDRGNENETISFVRSITRTRESCSTVEKGDGPIRDRRNVGK
ncbi:hypothetical protein PM082_014304 [Marasmius tenuissimus]|nr:hypothetical protein PM082_014304 [Marasmius tenuissimus]